MATEKLVRWDEGSWEFFEEAADNSVVLDLVVSYGCISQTGEGFEELVNSINSESIKRKVKKVVITDTSYLYRHLINDFSGYYDANIPTEWFLKNKSAIEKLNVDVEVKSWATGLQKDGFQGWHEQAKRDFFRDLNFKNAVIESVMEFTEESFYDFDIGRNIDFILEETAYTASNFKDAIIAYPTGVSLPISIAIDKYNLNTQFLSYRVSNHAQKHGMKIINRDTINREIAKFMEKANNVNFFVIDREGNVIFKNQSLAGIVGETNAKELAPSTWTNSLKVMEKKQTIVFEESDKGKTFLSVKSPMIINNSVEGVIGLAIDITDRKKAEQLQDELRKQKEFHAISQEIAHDIASPVSALKVVEYAYRDKLTANDSRMLSQAILSIENLTKNLNEKLRRKNLFNVLGDINYTSPYACIYEIVESRRFQLEHEDCNINLNFYPDEKSKMAVVEGDYTDFYRMIVNFLKNSIEALKNRTGTVDLFLGVKDAKVEIMIRDNGMGMPQETVEKIMRGMEVGTSKRYGHGIGMQQVRRTIRKMKGHLTVKSQENVGSEFVVTFTKTQAPKLIVEQIELSKGDTVILLDEDVETQEIWKKRFAEFENDLTVKCFSKTSDAADFIRAFEDKNKSFLITEYDFRNDLMSGIDFIESSGMQRNRVILSTRTHLPKIDGLESFVRMGGKYLNKLFLEDITLIVK